MAGLPHSIVVIPLRNGGGWWRWVCGWCGRRVQYLYRRGDGEPVGEVVGCARCLRCDAAPVYLSELHAIQEREVRKQNSYLKVRSAHLRKPSMVGYVDKRPRKTAYRWKPDDVRWMRAGRRPPGVGGGGGQEAGTTEPGGGKNGSPVGGR